MASNYVPQVDYTSRDFTALRNDLISLIPNFAPLWTNRDTADFGMTLIDLFAYMGDSLNYYIDRAANEAYITTASQRDNVVQLATLLDYIPTKPTPSTVTLTFQNSTATPIVVPALTQVATTTVASGSTTQVVFETTSAVTVPAISGITNGSATVPALQGTTITSENIGVSDGTANQQWQLANTSVITNGITLLINGVTWSEVNYLVDYGTADPVFTTYTNSLGTTYIIFGDGVGGAIPAVGATIYATYRIGGGVIGNVATGTIKYILTNAVNGLSVLNQDVSTAGDGAATGGADQESTDSIRINAPASVRTLNRAVSLSDYAALVTQVSGVAKAIANADVYTSVTVYFAPFGDTGVKGDGVTPSTTFNGLKAIVSNYLLNKIPANTTVTLQPPFYVPIDLNIVITVSPQYRQTLVQTAVTSALTNLLLFSNVTFNDRVSLQSVLTAIGSVPGVAYVTLPLMVRHDALQSYTTGYKSLTSNVANLTTTVNHTLQVGNVVQITGIDSTFNGTFAVTGVGTLSSSITAITPSSPAVGSVTYTGTNTFGVGQSVVISGASVAGYNGTFTVTAVTPTTFTVLNSTPGAATTASAVTAGNAYFTYNQIATNVASTAAAGTALNLVAGDVFCAINEIPSLGTLTYTLSGGITN
jgi:hypothetical protein